MRQRTRKEKMCERCKLTTSTKRFINTYNLAWMPLTQRICFNCYRIRVRELRMQKRRFPTWKSLRS